VVLPWDMVTAVLVQLEGHGTHPDRQGHTPMPDRFPAPQADPCTTVAVEAIRSVNGTPKVETEIRYFLSSCRDDPAILGKAIRTHWAIENRLHWVLDVTFREDDSRVRDHHAARNLAILRKVAINLVSRDRSAKASIRARRKKAAWDDNYMRQLLAG